MRHNCEKKSLGRVTAQRKALLRSLAESLVLHGHIRTTIVKAKVLRQVIEPLITKARKNTLTSRREALKVLYTEKAVNKLMNEVAPKYKTRTGGYVRIIRLAVRKNDSAKMARIEFV